LNRAFLQAFAAVTAWKEGYTKPKMHLMEHLSVKTHGPFRAYWCMPWEAFLQILKRMFEMTNYKSAPTSVATFWLVRAIQRWRNPARTSWHEDTVEASSETHFDVAEQCTINPCIRACIELRPYM
jgi:hypothetical protein